MKTTQMQEAERLFNTTDIPVGEIATTVGVDVSTVYTWAKKHSWRTDRIKDHEQLRFDASVLYIKHGLSLNAISKHIGSSLPTISKWSKEGRWNELRPDLSVMNEYKAAAMYISDQMEVAEICSKLSLPETTVRIWIDLNGWETPRNLGRVQSATAEIVNCYCTCFKSLFPHLTTEVEFAKKEFTKTITGINNI